MNEKNSKKPTAMVFNCMWSLCTVPDFPTIGKSCCEVIRTPSLREIINTYAETGQIIVHTNSFPDDIPGDDSKLGEYDIVDAWRDAHQLEDLRASAIASKKLADKSYFEPSKEAPKEAPKETPKETPQESD